MIDAIVMLVWGQSQISINLGQGYVATSDILNYSESESVLLVYNTN